MLQISFFGDGGGKRSDAPKLAEIFGCLRLLLWLMSLLSICLGNWRLAFAVTPLILLLDCTLALSFFSPLL